MNIQEYIKLKQIHDTYNKHEIRNGICITCGKITQYPADIPKNKEGEFYAAIFLNSDNWYLNNMYLFPVDCLFKIPLEIIKKYKKVAKYTFLNLIKKPKKLEKFLENFPEGYPILTTKIFDSHFNNLTKKTKEKIIEFLYNNPNKKIYNNIASYMASNCNNLKDFKNEFVLKKYLLILSPNKNTTLNNLKFIMKKHKTKIIKLMTY